MLESNWSIRSLKNKDVDAVLSLWNTRLGEDYPDPSVLKSALGEDQDTTCVVSVDAEDKVLGFAIATALSPADLDERVVPEAITKGDCKIGLLDTNCVAEHAEGQGIGTALTRVRLDRLREQGIEQVFAISWIRTDERDSSEILERVGFEPINEIPEFWYEESLNAGYKCPDCGNPCTCTARVYQKEICR